MCIRDRPHTVEHLRVGDAAPDRAARYGSADALVMLDPVDGGLGAPLEAMHAGVTVVVLPAGGHAELVHHLVDGVVADPDDARGIARWLDQLASDRELLARLREGALTTPRRRWPARWSAWSPSPRPPTPAGRSG